MLLLFALLLPSNCQVNVQTQLSENQYFSFTVSATASIQRLFLMTADNAIAFSVTVYPTVPPQYTRNLTLTSAMTTVNQNIGNNPGKTCPLSVSSSPSIVIFAYYSGNQWAICGPSFGQCAVDPRPDYYNTSTITHIKTATPDVELIKRCNMTETQNIPGQPVTPCS